MGNGQLDLVDLDQDAEGYRQFLSCWVCRRDDLTFVIDPGPSSTIDHLVSRLEDMGVVQLDLILLTHIHLDHGGGTADILNRFPGAKVYCHEKGVRHLLDPTALWEGSRVVLGDVADMYGRPDPLPPDALTGEDDLASRGIGVLPTPGHAAHHVSFLHDRVLFAGEALGTHVVLPSGRLYLRPATPPRFFLEQALESLEKLRRLDPEPEVTAFAHWGRRKGCFEYVDAARDQLRRWIDTIGQLRAESEEGLEQRLFERLMETDPLYGMGLYEELDDDLMVRERHFLGNTLDGMVGYLKTVEGG